MKEIKCDNCTNYVQHYRKSNDDFYKVCSGHCKKIKENGGFRKVDKPCEYFELVNTKKVKKGEIESVTKILKDINIQLSALQKILTT